MTFEDLADSMVPLADHVSRRGTINMTFRSLVTTSALLGLAIGAGLAASWSYDDDSIGFVVPFVAAAIAYTVFFMIFAYWGAPAFAVLTWSRFLSGNPGGGVPWNPLAAIRDLRSGAKLGDMAKRPRHVVCATELKSASHIYFSADGITSPVYGSAQANEALEFPIALAVAASAAFPPVFPPQLLPVSRFGFHMTEAEVGRHLVLLDGGVHDNLAAEWLIEEMRTSSLRKEKAQFVCVNAAPFDEWRARTNRLVAYARVLAVLQRSNTRTRIAFLEEKAREDGISAVVVHITETPSALAERLSRQSTEVAARLSAAFGNTHSEFGSWSSERWTDYTNRTARTATVLSRLKPDRVAELAYQGYCQGLIAGYAIYGGETAEVRPFNEVRIALGLTDR